MTRPSVSRQSQGLDPSHAGCFRPSSSSMSISQDGLLLPFLPIPYTVEASVWIIRPRCQGSWSKFNGTGVVLHTWHTCPFPSSKESRWQPGSVELQLRKGGGEVVSTSVWGRCCLPTTSVVHLFAGFPDSKPIKVITDSIGKDFPTHRLWSHHMLSSKIFKDATERKISGDIRVGSLRVIVFHLGTDSRDYRGWGGKVSCQQQLSSMQEEVKALYMPVRRLNSTCFIVFLAVLSHGCDWQHTQKLHLAFNHFLQSFTRGEQCGFMPTFAPFIYKDGPMKGHSIESLFAVRDGGLHLNLMGHHAGVHRSVQIGIVVKAAT